MCLIFNLTFILMYLKIKFDKIVCGVCFDEKM